MWTSADSRKSKLEKWNVVAMSFAIVFFSLVFSGCGIVPRAKSFDVKNDLGEVQHFDCKDMTWYGSCKSWSCMRCAKR